MLREAGQDVVAVTPRQDFRVVAAVPHARASLTPGLVGR
jgi:hypothetical protein